jgi:hypothetical protein
MMDWRKEEDFQRERQYWDEFEKTSWWDAIKIFLMRIFMVVKK